MKEKSKNNSDSDSNGSEHELSHYIDDRIKLMQVALKLIKPKKLSTMIPDCIKDLPMSEVKKLLLDELLGISKKRLRYILAGENLNQDTSSSSESEVEKETPIDVISLDDITDSTEIYISDDNCMEIELSERERLEMEIERPKIEKKSKSLATDIQKKVHKTKVKKEKLDKTKKRYKKKASNIKKEKVEYEPEDPVMNVLNLLELQARARAIRSQLANEVHVDIKSEEQDPIEAAAKETLEHIVGEDSDNSVIFISPKNTPVVTVHSDSEVEKKSTGEEMEQNEEEKKLALTNTIIELPEPKTDILNKIIDDNQNDDDNDILIVTEESILDKSESECTPQTKQDENQTESEEMNNVQTDVTWKSRWLESSKVKNVMRTTKIYNSLRQSRKLRQATEENSVIGVMSDELEIDNSVSST